jgi:hypothetical protein
MCRAIRAIPNAEIVHDWPENALAQKCLQVLEYLLGKWAREEPGFLLLSVPVIVPGFLALIKMTSSRPEKATTLSEPEESNKIDRPTTPPRNCIVVNERIAAGSDGDASDHRIVVERFPFEMSV